MKLDTYPLRAACVDNLFRAYASKHGDLAARNKGKIIVKAK